MGEAGNFAYGAVAARLAIPLSAAEIPAGMSTDREQCFLHGFDFNKISAERISDSNVVIAFECGYLTVYQNFASIREGREISDDFNAKLIDTCHTYKWAPLKWK